MKIEIKVPSAGESVSQATVATIMKASGTLVKVDEEIIELETDKLNQVVFAPAAGKLEISVKVGDVVKVGQTLGFIDTTAEEAPKEKGKSVKEAAPEENEKSLKEAAPEEKEKSTKQVRSQEEKLSKPEPLKEKSSKLPEARKKVDAALKEIHVEEKKKPSEPFALPKEKVSVDGRETRQKMSKLRRVIAERLVQVKNQTAMLTTFNEVDMTEVMAVREKEQKNFQKRHEGKLGFMSFFIKSAAYF
jgi:2-oxoglutarate dehydrogenase E2 component (dihydrolipoamide succinyltransferase)